MKSAGFCRRHRHRIRAHRGGRSASGAAADPVESWHSGIAKCDVGAELALVLLASLLAQNGDGQSVDRQDAVIARGLEPSPKWIRLRAS